MQAARSLLLALALTSAGVGAVEPVGRVAPKPLYRDPVFDGAADPTIVYDRAEKKWLMFYTNRRANVPGLTAVTWVHGTPIGIAESADGAEWKYRGTVELPKDIPGTDGATPTYWAPCVVEHAGIYHMFVTIVPGVFTDWQHPRNIVHVTSPDLKKWKYEGTLPLVTDKVIDPCVLQLPDGTWRMWYNNERAGKSTFYADSPDLFRWTDRGSAHLPKDRGEAPLAFVWKGYTWLLIDLLGNIGLGAYRSDDALTWERQPASLLDQPGTGTDDNNGGHHPEVIVSGDRAFLFYFVHPGVPDLKRSSIQVVELKLGADGWLSCDRNTPTHIRLSPSMESPPVSPSVPVALSPRMTARLGDLTYEYAPEDEPVVRELARVVAEGLARPMPPVPALAATGLSITEFRKHRADYLQRIAACIGLNQPTALQEECYDGFLEDFEVTDELIKNLMGSARSLFTVRAVSVFHKADLMQRLRAGERIPGFSLHPDGEHVSFGFNFPELTGRDERLAARMKQRERRRLDSGYHLATAADGRVDVSGYTTTRRSKTAPDPSPTPDEAGKELLESPAFAVPVVILPEQEHRVPAEIAADLAKSVLSFREIPSRMEAVVGQDPAALAMLLLHETAEIGIVERYLGSRDRRWLCEGVANYVTWKVVRDQVGAVAARRVHDDRARLADWADQRAQIKLQDWPAVENEPAGSRDTPLTKAHYAYATHAIFLLAEQQGEDFLPRLFREIGRTPRAMADMRTVEKAYRQLTGGDLAHLLAAAVAPPASSAR